MKTLLAILLIIGGVSYFNYKSKTELESAKCNIAMNTFVFSDNMKNLSDAFGGTNEADNFYVKALSSTFENCTLIEMTALVNTENMKKEYTGKIDRFLENVQK